MKMSFACDVDHEPEHLVLGLTVRVGLERVLWPVCPSQALEGNAAGTWSGPSCPCCGSQWRLEDDGFVFRSGRIVKEWT